MADFPVSWNAMTEGGDSAAKVREHLRFLARSPEDEKILDDLMDVFIAARLGEYGLDLVFRYAEYDDECEIRCSQPFPGTVSGNLPRSLADVVATHNGIAWSYLGGGSIGFFGIFGHDRIAGGGWESDALLEAPEENAEFLAELTAAGLGPDDVVSPFDYGQNWLIWHPARTNEIGEPALYFVSHGDCEAVPVRSAASLGVGQVLLRLMAQDILDQDIFPEVYS
jgi:hypothetical protein